MMSSAQRAIAWVAVKFSQTPQACAAAVNCVMTGLVAWGSTSATGRERKSGSCRRMACRGKLGMKTTANMGNVSSRRLRFEFAGFCEAAGFGNVQFQFAQQFLRFAVERLNRKSRAQGDPHLRGGNHWARHQHEAHGG